MNVSVFKMKGRKNFVCQWVDPITGKKKTRSTGTNIKRDAERFAGNLERDLTNGTYHEDLRMTWKEFRRRFEDDYLSGHPWTTAERYGTVLNVLEDLVNPKLLAAVNEAAISRFASGMRKKGNSEATVKTNLVHLNAALKWAVDQKFIPSAPKIRMPKNTEAMKGRPITKEEFERMLEKLPEVTRTNIPQWEFFLWGLWFSGLRLGEALKVHWTDCREMSIDLENEFFIIQASAQKRRKYTETAMAPEFVDLLQTVPEDQREGFVFNPVGTERKTLRTRTEAASTLITKLGKKAGVKVSETLSGKTKYASAHDIRRSFGARWARLVMPTELKELMRHKDISTTMKFYVGEDAKQTVKRLRAALANTLANTSEPASDEDSEEPNENPTKQDGSQKSPTGI